MEIRVKTIDEFRSERVTIEVAPGQRAEIEIVDGEVSKREHLFTSDEVAHYQSTEAELVAGPLRRRIAELEEMLVKEKVRANSLARQVQDYDTDRGRLEGELIRRASVIKKLENRVEAYDTDRDTERDRADRIAREHEACAGKLELREKDADTFRLQRNELENQVAALTRQIDNTRVILTDPQIKEIRDRVVSHQAVLLADAIGKALDTLA